MAAMARDTATRRAGRLLRVGVGAAVAAANAGAAVARPLTHQIGQILSHIR